MQLVRLPKQLLPPPAQAPISISSLLPRARVCPDEVRTTAVPALDHDMALLAQRPSAGHHWYGAVLYGFERLCGSVNGSKRYKEGSRLLDL